ncbi:gene transfer agent family protein [Methylobacterium oryzihabitans]|uniref:Gene transfer agent family protein n=1 Tax=Methylobacterium oryzihabitans TaxID=2499852 RepID=A0A437P5E8_9HYPH|nr:gene transfer agent family protein [Methylobacterium oryzihabitans]RVU17501.1 gene transfer agent family protein [Methylobacterium oryzihabitans]
MIAADTSRTRVRAPFGGRERSFQLRLGEMAELERLCGAGIGEIMARLATHRFTVNDVWETIRLGLEGAGTTPIEAQALVMRYHPPAWPLGEFLALAAEIVTASVSGVPAGKAGTEGSDAPAPATSPSTSPPGR